MSNLLLEGNLFEMKALTDLEVKMVMLMMAVPMKLKPWHLCPPCRNIKSKCQLGNIRANFHPQGWEQFMERHTATR